MSNPAPLKYVLTGLAAVLGMLVIVNMPSGAIGHIWLSDRMLSVHLVLELFSMMIAALVVMASWHTFDRREDSNTNAFIAGFVVVLTCDLFHALGYEGMPAFITESSTPRAIFFWLMARSFEVLTLGAIALSLVPRTSRATSLGIGLALSAVIVAFGSWGLDLFPVTFVEGMGVTAFKARFEYGLVALNLAVALLLWRQAHQTRSRTPALLGLSSLFMGIGGFAYTNYLAPSDFQNIAGHLYKVAAYALLYKVTFIISLRAPFDALNASEAQLRESQARMAAIGANLPQSMFYQLVLAPDGSRRLTEVSESVERLVGLSARDLLADVNRFYERILAADQPAYAAAEAESARALKVFNFEARVTRMDGMLRRVHFVSAPRLQEDGRIIWDGVATDITERVEAEEARRRLELQLFEAQKMESIGTLASGIAHDFNNVLAAILGNASMAIEDVERGSRGEALQSLQQIRSAGLRARSLVNQILGFSRRQPTQRQVQDLRPILEESLTLLRATLPEKVHLIEHWEAPQACALVDSTQIQQVVLNLCTNAWHALGEQEGNIEVSLRQVERAGSDGEPPQPWVQISVEDEGCGMDEATRQRIFEPFFTTKPMGQGTGLGLAVVHRIVQEHGGVIEVDSAPGRGTRFDVFLPCVDGTTHPTRAAAPATTTTRPPAGRGQRVMYVDDEPVMVEMVGKLLQRAGYRATCLMDPAQAIALLEKDPGSVDILVTDYRMPVHSGLDLIRAVRRLNPELPLVLASGFVSEALRQEARGEGVVHVLEKQKSLDELLPTIASLLAGSGGQQALA